ncbi:hypothetical protein GON03_17360 [Nocardioides sp. MAH-18]|uniref:Uncharacterized protein n=1 Tax=Nocardioides agri TaxID=2682843 RepID=A0A6L6XV67_9ACTN|nr:MULTISPECIES: hypothetical protein [unclassified Nocardioides]MBA2956112.1 hypothetical protein [Nocardioides sp. CGMCC 1.13656]MVQ50958.1 hypothetical protein [Nocardioides sp. MAH-18]
MYLDTFLGAIGVDAGVVAKIRSNLDAFADDIGGAKLPQAGGFGGSSAGHRMTTETNAAQEFIVSAMQDLADGLRDFGINLELWQEDMAYTDDDAAVQIQAIQKVQETVAEAVRAPVTVPAPGGGA